MNIKSVFAGDIMQKEDAPFYFGAKSMQSSQKTNSLFPNNKEEGLSPIEQKKAEAREKARKIVGDVMTSDKAIDDDLNARREHMKSLVNEISSIQDELKQLDESEKMLRKEYGVEEGDLGSEEYRKLAADFLERRMDCNQRIGNAKNEFYGEEVTIREIKRERLKSHAMVDANQEADAVLQAASDEILGMLISEGKEHLDEEMQEKIEQAEEKKEEEKELEERLEAIKGDKEKKTQETEDMKVETSEVVDLEQQQSKAQQEIENMVAKMNLLIEDIKGSTVDSKL